MSDGEIEIGLTNFHDGDKSLWTKTKGICNCCGGTIYILATQYNERWATADMYAACEQCGISGDAQGLLMTTENEYPIKPPMESQP